MIIMVANQTINDLINALCELKAKAKARGMSGYSTMKKIELIAALRRKK